MPNQNQFARQTAAVLMASGLIASLLPGFAAAQDLSTQTTPHRDQLRIPASTHNLLLDAKVSGNLESFGKGLRGAPADLIYDAVNHRFRQPSQWHEYGVGFDQDLGVVPEAKPAFMLAEWPAPVRANFIVLSGVYPNQPQPNTAWKIELRRQGQWTTHARGTGGWYDRGLYVWGGATQTPVEFDALRVSVFSKDDQTPLKSIHFRGEEKLSWLVVRLAPLDARITRPAAPLRAGQPTQWSAEPLAGQIQTWRWSFGEDATVGGRTVTHTFAEPGEYSVSLTVSDGQHTVTVRDSVRVIVPLQVDLEPLTGQVMAGQPFHLTARTVFGTPTRFSWDMCDGRTVTGARVSHTYAQPGLYQVWLTATDGRYTNRCLALLRAHTETTRHLPQVLLDTDAKNEQDDQHYLGYGLFSELDLLGINSTHHGGGQEPINYGEIQHVIKLARQSGLPAHRVPPVFRGANRRLAVPGSGDWRDTEPVPTPASEAILAAARGAAPGHSVWIVPVGPGSNPASAVLQAQREGIELKDRIRIIWLGGSDREVINEFNGNNDPWSMYVVAQSGLETWIMPAPVGARVAVDKRTEGNLYAEHPLGRYLFEIMPASHKALYDASCLSAIIGERLGLGWVKETEWVTVAGPGDGYRWTKSAAPTSVRVIRQIDQQAMQRDLFQTMKGQPTRLVGVAP
ncbi:MAG: PKD domain-containing protein [Verrucomicrobia bacterium]|nr:PKD domain-containing protein [Verrucomicrobiota bacterium]